MVDTVQTAPLEERIAQVFSRVADLLETQGANPHRVRAYRRGAQAVRGLRGRVADILRREGEGGLVAIPHIGRGLAAAAAEVADTGRCRILDRLEGIASPEDAFLRVPGIGEELARRIHEQLGIETLEELEVAAHDGRLARVPGFGERRLAAVQASVDAILRRSLVRPRPPLREPPVELLLTVDARYRRLAREGRLHRIRPHRFNPRGSVWLPIMHWERDGWTFHALFSNTARAHALHKTDDWVVIYYQHDRHGLEHQCTVVTETHGPLAGERVVRGREAELLRAA